MTGPNWEAITTAIHGRDRHRCMNCYREGDDVTLDVHHVVPRGQGGSNRFTNLILLCRQCHDAAHGNTMAPRVKWYTNGEMDSEEFELFRELFKSLEMVRFDDGEKCWYIPKADVERLVEQEDESAQPERVSPDPTTDLAAFI